MREVKCFAVVWFSGKKKSLSILHFSGLVLPPSERKYRVRKKGEGKKTLTAGCTRGSANFNDFKKKSRVALSRQSIDRVIASADVYYSERKKNCGIVLKQSHIRERVGVYIYIVHVMCMRETARRRSLVFIARAERGFLLKLPRALGNECVYVCARGRYQVCYARKCDCLARNATRLSLCISLERLCIQWSVVL